MSSAAAAEKPRSSTFYQALLVGLLSLNFGIVFFDRNALNFLMPFVQPDLGLSNTQVGLLASALSLTWSFAAFGVGRLSDATGAGAQHQCDRAVPRRRPRCVGHVAPFSSGVGFRRIRPVTVATRGRRSWRSSG